MVEVKDKYFKAKYGSARMILKVNAVISFKFKLQLKFRNKITLL
jgi:hypothetical protein